MGRYKSESQRRREAQNRKGVLQLGVALAILAGILLLYLWTASSRRTLDPETMCPAIPDSLTVLLVDVTDPMNLAQRQDFRNQLERLRSSIPRYGKLSIFQVESASGELLNPVIERCNPGTAEDVDEWTGNPQSAAKLWAEGFEKPLDEAFERISTASGSQRSPILESVQSVALTELKVQEADDRPRRLVLASDLLQNTDRMSFYGRLPSPEIVLASNAFRMLRTDLRDIDFELWMLQRPDSQQSQPRDLITLWEVLVGEQGGEVERAYTVSG